MQTKILPNTNMGLVGMVMCTVHTTQQNTWIGSIHKIMFFHWLRQCRQYLSLHNFSQPDFHHMCPSHIYIYVIHLTFLWKYLQAYNIEGTVQQEKDQKFQRASRALGIV